MGVASGCGEQEVGVASGSGWNLWVWLLGVVLRRYIDFLILLIPTPLVSVLFLQQHSYFFVHLKKCFSFFIYMYYATFSITELGAGERPLIHVVHDACTFNANSDQSFVYGDDQTNVLRQKSLGASMMVSDFYG